MKLTNHENYTKLMFDAPGIEPLYFSPGICSLLDYLNEILNGEHQGTTNIITAESGCGKTALMAGFRHELLQQSKTCEYRSAQEFVTDLILAISRDTVAAFLHRTSNVLIIDDCFTLLPTTIQALAKLQEASPNTTIILLFDSDLHEVNRNILPHLSVAKVYGISYPNKAARQAFVQDYLCENPHLNVTKERAMELAGKHKRIPALRAAIKSEDFDLHIKCSLYQQGGTKKWTHL